MARRDAITTGDLPVCWPRGGLGMLWSRFSFHLEMLKSIEIYWNLLKSIEIYWNLLIIIYTVDISVDMCRWFLNGLDTDRWRLFRCKYRGQARGNFHEHNISETFWNVRYFHFRSFQYVSIHSRPVSFSDSWTAGSQSSWSRRKGA